MSGLSSESNFHVNRIPPLFLTVVSFIARRALGTEEIFSKYLGMNGWKKGNKNLVVQLMILHVLGGVNVSYV